MVFFTTNSAATAGGVGSQSTTTIHVVSIASASAAAADFNSLFSTIHAKQLVVVVVERRARLCRSPSSAAITAAAAAAPSVAAAIERMESLNEAMQMAELLATLLIQEDLSSERLTAYTQIAAQAFVNHHESDALEFAQSELQAWLFDEVLAFASDENFLNLARTTFASSTRSGESGDVFGEDILYAAEALAAYQMSERRYDDGSTTDPIVTSASFSELTREPSSILLSSSSSSSSSSSIDDDVRASIARDRLSRLVSPSLLGDPQLLASALQPSLFASLLSDPSVLAYLTTAFGASDSITSSLAG